MRSFSGILSCVLLFGGVMPGVAESGSGAEQTTGSKISSESEPMLAEIHMVAPGNYAPTMEEIARNTDPPVSTPDEALQRLKRGNARFFSGEGTAHGESANARRAQIMTQTPFAIVLGCSDSRVPIEIVFDQGLGAVFSIRVAGNIADPATLGSIEYAVRHLDSKIVVVMGHEGCGAVAAAMLPRGQQEKEPENVRYLLKAVSPAVEGLPQIRDKKARMREAVISNVRSQVAELRQNPVVAAAEKDGKIKLVGAFYEISSGAVDFLETKEELALEPLAGSAAAAH